MKRRQWDSKTKAKIVLEVLSGSSVSSVCSKYQLSQTQYYQWRDKFLAESYRAFENGRSPREEKLKDRIATLERAYGAISFELKKTKESSIEKRVSISC